MIRYIDVGMATYRQGLTFQLPEDQMNRYNFLAPEVREGGRTTTRSDIYRLDLVCSFLWFLCCCFFFFPLFFLCFNDSAINEGCRSESFLRF